MTLFQSILIAIVEGITEFLPVSSTGHMIIVSTLMGINNDEFTKIFEVNIQFGAILAVVFLYFKRFFNSFDFYLRLLVAFIPTAILGLLLDKHIDALLGNVIVVAINLLLGGIFLLFVDKMFPKATDGNEKIPFPKAAIIGTFQALAMLPGVSRSAATIIGGQTQGLSRKAAAEFSFFLAVPTMFAASALKLLKGYKAINSDNISLLLVGNVVAFVVAALAIKFFIDFLTKHGFKMFGYYRIAVGLLILGLYAAGFELKMD